MIAPFSYLKSLPLLSLAQTEGGFWFPPQASTVAGDVDWAFFFIYAISVFGFFLAVIWMTYFVIKYRRREGVEAEKTPTHNTALEITWTLIPMILIVFIFYFGLTGYVDIRTAPRNAYNINVTAQKWNWMFTYPTGTLAPELHVPVNKPIRLTMTSEDVIHSLFIPAFRIKYDVVPGRYHTAWFQATQVGSFQILCTEYCGTGHSDMLSMVVVHPEGEFETWLENEADVTKSLPPVEAGAKLFVKFGCQQCHNVDGTRKIGPPLNGIFGHKVVMKDGASVEVDENYLRESLFDPTAKVVAGFDPIMPTFQGKLKDKEVTAFIEYLKSLKE